MLKSIAVIAVAGLVAGAVVAIPGLTIKVEAHMLPAKGDRLDVKTYGSACSERGWPYYETSCLRDTNSPVRQARTVRVITIDHIPDLNSR